MTIEQIAVLGAVQWFKTYYQGMPNKAALVERASVLWPIHGDEKSVKRVYGEAVDSCYHAGYLIRSLDGYFLSNAGIYLLFISGRRLESLVQLIR